ncbi:MAG: magnetosome biogenesis CDF transporter MamM [Magnetococcales bacterium]|nr:magnetosome biogenesis CDF transporter MamM [Magnetococcales bacterium]
MRYFKCLGCNEIVGWIGLVTNLALAALKLFIGVLSGSHALVVDGLYSAKDVVTSVLIVIGLRVSKQPIDKEHPFGHGKVEFIISLVISLMLVGVVILLFTVAAGSLMEGNHQAPHIIALWAALLSVAVNLFLYRYTRCVANESNSPVVATLSQHHHADGTSSMAVAAGIIGSHYLGMPWLDTVVALGETVDLLILGAKIFWDSFQGLMDSSAPVEIEVAIREETRGVAGVKEVISLRTRRVGQEIWIDLVIGVDPELSILDARHITRRVEDALASAIPHTGDIAVQFKSMTGSVPELQAILPLIRPPRVEATPEPMEDEEAVIALPAAPAQLLLEDHHTEIDGVVYQSASAPRGSS